MDTDELTENAYDVIIHAAGISDTLKTYVGVQAGKCRMEDEWLRTVRARLVELVETPDGFVEFWNLEEFEGVTADMLATGAKELCGLVDGVLAMPMEERGETAW